MKTADPRACADILRISTRRSMYALTSSTSKGTNYRGVRRRIGPCEWRRGGHALHTMASYFPHRLCNETPERLLTANIGTQSCWACRRDRGFSLDRVDCRFPV